MATARSPTTPRPIRRTCWPTTVSRSSRISESRITISADIRWALDDHPDAEPRCGPRRAIVAGMACRASLIRAHGAPFFAAFSPVPERSNAARSSGCRGVLADGQRRPDRLAACSRHVCRYIGGGACADRRTVAGGRRDEDNDNGSAEELAGLLLHGSYVGIPGNHMSAVTRPELAGRSWSSCSPCLRALRPTTKWVGVRRSHDDRYAVGVGMGREPEVPRAADQAAPHPCKCASGSRVERLTVSSTTLDCKSRTFGIRSSLLSTTLLSESRSLP